MCSKTSEPVQRNCKNLKKTLRYAADKELWPKAMKITQELLKFGEF